jgi:hypothetical protein
VIALGGVAAALALSGCSVNTPPDMVALHFRGGAIESREFAGCVAPSTREYSNGGDAYYMYPSSQRYYEFDSSKQTDSASITFVTKDGIEMTVTGVTNFDLNSDCDTLRAFHERIGNRAGAYFTDSSSIPDGWNNMLDVYVGGPLNTAVDRAGQKYKYNDLYNDGATKAAWENDVLALLPELVNRQTDGDEVFFQNFAITLQKPEPPQAIKDALVEQQASVKRAEAAKAEADAKVQTAKAQKALEQAEAAKVEEWIKVLGVSGYLKKLAIESGQNPYQPNGTILQPKAAE